MEFLKETNTHMIRQVDDVDAEIDKLLRTGMASVAFLDDDGFPVNYTLSMFRVYSVPEEKGKLAVGTIASSNKVRFLKKHNKVSVSIGSPMKYNASGRLFCTARVIKQDDYNGALQNELWHHQDPVHKDLDLGEVHYSKHFFDYKDKDFVILLFDIVKTEFNDTTAYRFAPMMGLHKTREEQLEAQKKWEEENNQPFPPYRARGLTV